MYLPINQARSYVEAHAPNTAAHHAIWGFITWLQHQSWSEGYCSRTMWILHDNNVIAHASTHE